MRVTCGASDAPRLQDHLEFNRLGSPNQRFLGRPDPSDATPLETERTLVKLDSARTGNYPAMPTFSCRLENLRQRENVVRIGTVRFVPRPSDDFEIPG